MEQLVLFLTANNDLLFGITLPRAKCQASLSDLFQIILIQKLIYTGGNIVEDLQTNVRL